MTFRDVAQAIRTALVTASGLSSAAVFFEDQTPRPTYPASGTFMTLRFSDVVPLGAVDAVIRDYDAGRPLNQEVRLTVHGHRELGISVQVRGAPTDDAAASALAVAHAAAQGLRLPSVRGTLTAAGVSPFDVGAVRNLGALLGTAFEGRALFEIRSYVRFDVAEFVGYIASMGITDLQTSTLYTVTE